MLFPRNTEEATKTKAALKLARMQFCFLRQLLETAVMEMACDVATQEDILILEENLNQQEFYLKNPSPARLLETDD